jgi:hypothetical protein
MTLPRRAASTANQFQSHRQGAQRHPASTPGSRRKAPAGLEISWTAAISKREWGIYLSAIRALRAADVPILLGGGFALAAYTGRWRDTKDIDFYVHPRDRAAAVKALSAAGFKDYYGRVPYDRKWIHRNVRSDMIVDIIWAMANQRAQVDQLWFDRAGSVAIRGEQLAVLPLEEILWCKLYIMQRDHCDWTDIFNLLYARGHELDWDHLVGRLGPDVPLLKAMLSVYGWLCPARARRLPIWRRLGLPLPARVSGSASRQRMSLLDTRAWFAGHQPPEKKLEV